MTFAGDAQSVAADTDREAPLAIVSHSLGTVIASNCLWDLQNDKVAQSVLDARVDILARLSGRGTNGLPRPGGEPKKGTLRCDKTC